MGLDPADEAPDVALESIVSASSLAMTPGAFFVSRASLRPTGLETSPELGVRGA